MTTNRKPGLLWAPTLSVLLISFIFGINLSFAIEDTKNLPLNSELATDGASDSVSSDSKSIFFGHLLTPTSYLPKEGVVTAGTHITGYSLTDNLLIGTSTFLLLFYNSPNLYLKYGEQINPKQRWAVQVDYLKSSDAYEFGTTKYVMDALMVWGVWSYDVTEFYTFHSSLNYMYFYNEGNPHSLRREPFNDDAYQFSITTLHDVKVSEKFGLASEIGILGLNYEIPNLHGAVSFRYTAKNLLLQVGISFDTHLPRRSFTPDDYMANNPTLGISNRKEFTTHPEFAIQYFF